MGNIQLGASSINWNIKERVKNKKKRFFMILAKTADSKEKANKLCLIFHLLWNIRSKTVRGAILR